MTAEVLKMDDLQFRRTIYADANCSDENIKQAATDDPKKQAFWDEVKQLDAKMQSACKVDVPEGLSERLILRQALQRHQTQRTKNRVNLAIAASIAFIFGISLTLLQQNPTLDLSEHAFAHIYHEGDGFALKVDHNVSIENVNAKLVNMGVEMPQDLGRIYFANYCTFEGLKTFHMVMQGDHGKVTIFIVPDGKNQKVSEHFSDGKMHGQILDMGRGKIIIVGEEGQSFSGLSNKLKQQTVFSA